MGQRLLLVNIGWYVILAIAYAVDSNNPKMLYFLGAAILSVGVYYME